MSEDSAVFISYSRHDQDFVGQLVSDLRSHGVHAWRDVENIAAGANWHDELEKGLKNAKALIFILSKHSSHSKWMMAELGAFWGSGKPIYPIVIEDIDASSIPSPIAEIQWIDFKDSYHDGLSVLLKSLGVDTAPLTPVPDKPRTSKGYAFLSYAEEDTDFLDTLKSFLREEGYAYWDYEESDRDYHGQLFLELEGIIREASVTLSILSEAWKQSQWTVKEFFFSQEVETPVFLIKAKPTGPTLAIAGLTFIDFTKGDEQGFSKLDRELRRKKL